MKLFYETILSWRLDDVHDKNFHGLERIGSTWPNVMAYQQAFEDHIFEEVRAVASANLKHNTARPFRCRVRISTSDKHDKKKTNLKITFKTTYPPSFVQSLALLRPEGYVSNNRRFKKKSCFFIAATAKYRTINNSASDGNYTIRDYNGMSNPLATAEAIMILNPSSKKLFEKVKDWEFLRVCGILTNLRKYGE